MMVIIIILYGKRGQKVFMQKSPAECRPSVFSNSSIKKNWKRFRWNLYSMASDDIDDPESFHIM